MEEQSKPSSSIITASTKSNGVSSIITDSTRPGFTPPTTQTVESVQPVVDKPIQQNKQTVDKAVQDSYKEAIQEKTSPQAEREAAKLMKALMQQNLLQFKASDFETGNMMFYRYDAKDKEKTYDKTPLIIMLRKSRGYVLGLNLHWTPVILRITLLKLILKLNKQNIMNNKPIDISYQTLKPIITKMGLGPVIRLYIFNRISRRGVVVPPTHWLIAAKLKSESFNNGLSAEQAYSKAIQKFKQTKLTRKRREHVWK